jgi:hypothetical protein
VPKGQRALFYRYWMTAEHGQDLSPVQAACWLDIKRTYTELRPALRRLYATTWPQYHGASPRIISLATPPDVIAASDFGADDNCAFWDLLQSSPIPGK